MNQNKIILASSSPRRKELFDKYNIDYIVEYVNTKEVLDENLTLLKRLENIAYLKAKPIKDKYPNNTVISADTTVLCDNKILGKAKDRQDAFNTLQLLSNNKQIVITAVCIMSDKCITFCEKTYVQFRNISNEEINEYLDCDEWIGKAGSYAIQGIASKFVENIDGDVENVIGLPMNKVIEYL